MVSLSKIVDTKNTKPASFLAKYNTRTGFVNSRTGVSYLPTNRGVGGLIGDGTYPRYFFDNLRGKKVLDVGTGGGELVLDVTKMGAKAIGIDIYPGRNFDFCPSSFKVADASDTGFAEKSFDCIYSSYSVLSSIYDENTAFKEKVLREMKRVLKNDGKIRLGAINFSEISALADKVGGLKITGRPQRLDFADKWIELTKIAKS